MKNISADKFKIMEKKWHFVESKTDIMQRVLNMQQMFLLPKIYKIKS